MQPTGIATDGVGNVYVAESGTARVSKFYTPTTPGDAVPATRARRVTLVKGH